MGDPFEEGDFFERPVHEVTVSPFYMGKHEVSKALWDRVYSWSLTNGYMFYHAGMAKETNEPVCGLSWYACVKWCNARSEMEGYDPAYTTNGSVYRAGEAIPHCNWGASGYRLPTEAEWEFAARGGITGQRFPWGDEITHAQADYFSTNFFSYDTSETRGFNPLYAVGEMPYTCPVNAFEPNSFGLYNMAGNVMEWCYDGSGDYSGEPQENPSGRDQGSERILRGGDWSDDADFSRTANRVSRLPFLTADTVGFRLLRQVSSP